MRHDERLKKLRQTLGLSVSEMAYLLGLSGNNANDRIREIERGARDMSGATLNLMAYIEAAAYSELPKFTNWLDSEFKEAFLSHNYWPRFNLFRSNSELTNAMNEQLKTGRLIILNDDNEAQRAILHWLDDPIKEQQPLINEALNQLSEYEQHH